MARAWQSRSAILIAASLAALLLAAPGAEAQRGAAVEEYTLTLPGSSRVGEQAQPLGAPGSLAHGAGVTGEDEPAGSTLAAFGSAAASSAGLALVVGALGAGVVALRRSRSPR